MTTPRWRKGRPAKMDLSPLPETLIVHGGNGAVAMTS